MFWGLDSSGLWKVLRNFGCANDKNDFVWDGDVDVLNNFFVGDSASDDPSDIDFDGLESSMNSFSFRCVDEIELLGALNKIKSGSIGIDNIPIKFIKIIFPHVSDLLLNIINSVFMSSVFPEFWKTARTVPIPKSKVINDLNDLRPISILPAISKIVEHLIKDQIVQSANDKIYESQYAFRKVQHLCYLVLLIPLGRI